MKTTQTSAVGRTMAVLLAGGILQLCPPLQAASPENGFAFLKSVDSFTAGYFKQSKQPAVADSDELATYLKSIGLDADGDADKVALAVKLRVRAIQDIAAMQGRMPDMKSLAFKTMFNEAVGQDPTGALTGLQPLKEAPSAPLMILPETPVPAAPALATPGRATPAPRQPAAQPAQEPAVADPPPDADKTIAAPDPKAPAAGAEAPIAAPDSDTGKVARAMANDIIKFDLKKLKDSKTEMADLNKVIGTQLGVLQIPADSPRVPMIKNTVFDLVADGFLPDSVADPKSESGKASRAALAKSFTAANLAAGPAPAAPAPAKTADAQTLSGFDTKFNGKTTLATVQLGSAYASLFQRNKGWKDHWYVPHLLGIQASASVPIGTPSLPDYLSSELLLRDGGLLNLYFTLSDAQSADFYTASNVWGDRKYAINRYYFSSDYGRQGSEKDGSGKSSPISIEAAQKLRSARELTILNSEILFYVSKAVGFKAFKTSVDSSTATSATTSAQALGTAYLGLGFDGPINAFGDGSGNGTGGIGFEIFATGNLANRNALNAAFATTRARSAFGAWGLTGKISLPGHFEVSATYGTAFGRAAHSFMKDVTTFSIAYNKNGGAGTQKPTPAP